MVSDREDGLEPRYWIREDGSRIAYGRLAGRSPTVVFLGGFSSDMTGAKATHLDAWCRERCALQAHEIQSSEMAILIKPSQQSGTESCVVFR